MIALYPGAFKPPHRGHFNVVSSLLNNNYVGSTYDINDFAEKGTSVLKGKTSGKVNIDKVIVFVGGGERNGITKQEAESIWQVYQQYLPGLEIVDGQKNPMFAAKDYAKANPNDEFVAITGIRSEDDFVDLKRVTTFKNTPNVQGLAITTAGGSGIRATDFRNKILSGNLDDILDFLNSNHIGSRPCWELMHKLPYLKNFSKMNMTGSEQIYQKIINIPSSANILQSN